METRELRKEVEQRLSGGAITEPVRPAVSTAAQAQIGVGLRGVQSERRSILWWALNYVFSPWRTFSLHQQMREERRIETLSKVQVTQGDLTYQDLEIRLSGELLPRRTMEELFQGNGTRGGNLFRSVFDKTHRA